MEGIFWLLVFAGSCCLAFWMSRSLYRQMKAQAAGSSDDGEHSAQLRGSGPADWPAKHSSGGWQSFRFGMSPGEAATTAKKAGFENISNPEIVSRFDRVGCPAIVRVVAHHPNGLGAIPTKISLTFLDDALYEIEIRPEGESDQSWPQKTIDGITAGLNQKRGECESDFKDDQIQYDWASDEDAKDADGMSISLTVSDKFGSDLTYTDDAGWDAALEAKIEWDERQARETADKLDL